MNFLTRVTSLLSTRADTLSTNPNHTDNPLSHIVFAQEGRHERIEILTDFDRSKRGYQKALQTLCDALSERYPGREIAYKTDNNEVFFYPIKNDEERQAILLNLQSLASGVLGQRQQTLFDALSLSEAPALVSYFDGNLNRTINYKDKARLAEIPPGGKISASFPVKVPLALRNCESEAAFVLERVLQHNGYKARAYTGPVRTSPGNVEQIDLCFDGAAPDIEPLLTQMRSFPMQPKLLGNALG